ncbi:hypothetical protein ABB55_06005 [Prosthecomicrobium hirschii]|uniref:Uncharacterized protein n=2 Tax=Prosthecodimorpha hirschii TaxID=665126 RepID=A0A0P6VID6_9HYPH|nr:hypothetical protein [Prosthecomicrobium hirschii]KPL51838.1 hypothetical protein ABB55_06005 [Prosthecomicrobium hirschii]TPQ51478.1 hypothetical protein C2U72_08120 [Prosthecomicrobium hirschii]
MKMSAKDNQGKEAQFSQGIPPKRESVTLDKQYKSIGISAVSAAASVKPVKGKKLNSNQMG